MLTKLVSSASNATQMKSRKYLVKFNFCTIALEIHRCACSDKCSQSGISRSYLSIPSYLSDKIERVQRRSLRILYPNMSYSAALATSSLPRLSDRRDTLCKKVLDKITVPSSRLNRLLPPTRVESHGRELRHSSHFSLFKCRTDRFKNSFFPAMCSRTMNKS